VPAESGVLLIGSRKILQFGGKIMIQSGRLSVPESKSAFPEEKAFIPREGFSARKGKLPIVNERLPGMKVNLPITRAGFSRARKRALSRNRCFPEPLAHLSLNIVCA